MMKKIEKINCNFEIVDREEKDGLEIKNKNTKITLYDNDLILNAIEKNFNKKYRELLYIVMDIVENEDSTDTDSELVLYKIDNFKNILIKKYFKYLPLELRNKYNNMILLLMEKLNSKTIRKGR